MSILVVNGAELPTPDLGLKFTGSQGAEAGRNALYQMVVSPVNRRILKFDTLTWSNLLPEQWSIIKKEIDKFTGVLRFWDVVSMSFQYVDIYWGDDDAEIARMNDDGSIAAYKKCRCNIIDMGYPYKSGFY